MAQPLDVHVTKTVVIGDAHLDESFSRNSGPGGQSVNTSDSRVELRFHIGNFPGFSEQQKSQLHERLHTTLIDGCVVVTAAENRQQLANRKAARERLAQILREGLAPPPARRRATKPSRGSIERRLAGKKRRSSIKKDRRRPID